MKPQRSASKASRAPSATKAEIMGKYLFDGVSAKELSSQHGVSQRSIGVWRDLVRQGLDSFFTSNPENTEALCRELTSLKKELGEV